MTKQEFIEKANETISELVYDKHKLQKAYNYYNGIRDSELFKYLEENFGIGSPTSVEFTPLLRKHVDALVGEYLGTPILPKISCKDSETISNIGREKLLTIASETVKFLKQHLHKSILQIIQGKDIVDKAIKLQIDSIVEDINQSFISLYEIAALNIIEYLMQSREVDIITKLRQLLTDLLVTGYTFFRVKSSTVNTNVEIEVLNPLNTFIDRNPDSPYIKHSYRSVVRYWLSKSQIIAKYGSELKLNELKSLKEKWENTDGVYNSSYVDTCTIVTQQEYDLTPGYPFNKRNLIPVYDVEWIETDDDFVMQRYNVIRIGGDIFIVRGKDELVIRSKDNPNFCTLSVNGVFLLNRSQEPYSLILKCAHLLDRYDLLIYYRDNLIANSGTSGSIMDVSLIPANLGVTWSERVLKWIAYKKGGLQLIDTTQEGRNETGPINTIFNGFDDTLKAQAVQSIELAIQSVEQTTSSITGVFRERLNGIEQRDAVSNIKQGVTNSFTITKHYYLLMDLITSEILLAALNQAKITFKNGLTGSIILGDKYLKIFTALPEHYTLTDYDVHVVSSTDVMLDLLLIKQMIPEFIKSLLLSPEIIIDALTSKSLTDLKYKVQKAMSKQKQEMNLIGLLQQLLEQTTQLAQQLQKELEKANLKVQELNESKLQLEQQKIQLDYQVDWYKAQTDRTYRNRQMDIEEKRTKIEEALIRDGNPYNDQIKNL